MRKNDLSLSIQTFEKLIVERRIYVDKTQCLHTLITSEEACFLSRPRRFGKSLTVTTLESIFLGKKELFEGLAIAKTDYAWPVHPVIRLDMPYVTQETLARAEKGLVSAIKTIADWEMVQVVP